LLACAADSRGRHDDKGYLKVARRKRRQRDRKPRPYLTPEVEERAWHVWLCARTGVQLIELFSGKDEGLRLLAQTLVVLGDLVAAALRRQDCR
jgi:hypothetical protein